MAQQTCRSFPTRSSSISGSTSRGRGAPAPRAGARRRRARGRAAADRAAQALDRRAPRPRALSPAARARRRAGAPTLGAPHPREVDRRAARGDRRRRPGRPVLRLRAGAPRHRLRRARPRQAGAAAAPRPQGPQPARRASTPTATTASARAAPARTATASSTRARTSAATCATCSRSWRCTARPSAILVDARPHIGSNQLPKVVTRMRERLESVGRGVSLRRARRRRSRDARRDARVRGVRLADGSELEARRGGARDRPLGARRLRAAARARACALEAKAFALGVRIEHPQPLINRIQYGALAEHPTLPDARLSARATPSSERGVFSFCMCPGGFIVPAATEPDGLVVNGMSLSRRDSPLRQLGPGGRGRARRLAARRLRRAARRHRAAARDRARRLRGRRRRAARAGDARRPTSSRGRASSTRARHRATCPGLHADATSPRCSTRAGLPLADALRARARARSSKQHARLRDRGGRAGRRRVPHQLARARAARPRDARVARHRRPVSRRAKARATPAASSAPRWTACASRGRSPSVSVSAPPHLDPFLIRSRPALMRR